MTTLTDLTHLKDADVRPDVRTETHSHRHRNLTPDLTKVLFLLLTFMVCAGGLFAIAWTLGGTAYTVQAA